MAQQKAATLVCYDGSDSAKRAIEVLSAQLPGGEVTVLHVWRESVGVLPDAFSDSGAPGPSVAQLERVSAQRAQEIADQGKELAEACGLHATTLIESTHSESWKAILEAADAIDAGLIVLGTRGRVAFEPALLASVSGGVLWGSKRPLLIVPTPDDEA